MKINPINYRQDTQTFRGGIPHKIKSSEHSDFFSAPLQSKIRKYSEDKRQNKSVEDMVSEEYDLENKTGKQKRNLCAFYEEEYIPMLEEKIKIMDDSFKSLVPTLFARNHYKMFCENENPKSIKIINEAKEGDVITPDDGYMSASLSQKAALKSFGAGKSKTKALMKIITPAGSKISRNYAHLFEAVFPRGAKFQVIDKKQLENKDEMIITVRYLKDE